MYILHPLTGVGVGSLARTSVTSVRNADFNLLMSNSSSTSSSSSLLFLLPVMRVLEYSTIQYSVYIQPLGTTTTTTINTTTTTTYILLLLLLLLLYYFCYYYSTTGVPQQWQPCCQTIMSLVERCPLGRGRIHAFSVLTAENLCPFHRGVLSRECPLREGPLYYNYITHICITFSSILRVGI